MQIQKREAPLKTKFFLSMSSLTTSVTVLLLIIMSFIFYGHFFSVQAESSALQLNAVNKQLNFYLDSLDNYSRMMISDTMIQKNVIKYEDSGRNYAEAAKGSDPFELYTEADRTLLRSEMRKFLQTIPYIHSATIYADDYTCIASTATALSPAPLETLGAESQSVYAITQKFSNFNMKTEIQTLSLLRPFYEIATGKKLGYIEISIAEQDIAALYAANTSETSKLLITDRPGNIVSTDGTYQLNKLFAPIANQGGSIPKQFYTGNGSICFVSYIHDLDWFIVNEVKLSAFFQPLYRILMITVLIYLLFLAFSMVISRKVSETITKPLYLLIAHIQKVKQGNWSPLNNAPKDVDFHLLFQEFDSMLLSQEKLTQDLIVAQKTKDKLSLDLLQQQVNPHFLYNTLDNIGSLAELDETALLIRLVSNLSEFYRHSLSGGNLIVSIAEELELTQAYVNIMQIRYVDKFSFSMDCPGEIRARRCLKLLLQPIIENSIYHGVKELDGFGHITVQVLMCHSDIKFVIEDNGPGIPEEALNLQNISGKGHFGIQSIQKRIQMYYGDHYGLTMQNREQGGLRTIIIIPGEEGAEHEL